MMVGLVMVMNEYIVVMVLEIILFGLYVLLFEDFSFLWLFLLLVVKEVEVLVEMGVEYYFGKD